jgi:hypothetical protein
MCMAPKDGLYSKVIKANSPSYVQRTYFAGYKVCYFTAKKYSESKSCQCYGEEKLLCPRQSICSLAMP